MCKYNNLSYGQQTRINGTAVCNQCGREKRFNGTAAIYLGHITDRCVYDKFDLIYPFTCVCGNAVESYYELCETGARVGLIRRLFSEIEN